MRPETAQVVQGLFTLIQTVTMIYALYRAWDRVVGYFEKKLEYPDSYDKPGPIDLHIANSGA